MATSICRGLFIISNRVNFGISTSCARPVKYLRVNMCSQDRKKRYLIIRSDWLITNKDFMYYQNWKNDVPGGIHYFNEFLRYKATISRDKNSPHIIQLTLEINEICWPKSLNGNDYFCVAKFSHHNWMKPSLCLILRW